jgi:dihydrodipicolinate synthase/N-acetylneuraminate lyase
VLPEAMVALGTSLTAGDQDDARQQWLDLQRFNRFLDEPGAAVAACKTALTALGLPGGAPRDPLPPLDNATQALVQAALTDLPGAAARPVAAPVARFSVTLPPINGAGEA